MMPLTSAVNLLYLKGLLIIIFLSTLYIITFFFHYNDLVPMICRIFFYTPVFILTCMRSMLESVGGGFDPQNCSAFSSTVNFLLVR